MPMPRELCYSVSRAGELMRRVEAKQMSARLELHSARPGSTDRQRDVDVEIEGNGVQSKRTSTEENSVEFRASCTPTGQTPQEFTLKYDPNVNGYLVT